jgi:uncharacterized protein
MRKKHGIFGSATAKIILINIVVYFIVLIIGREKAVPYLALQPASIIAGQKLWTIFTSMFVHFETWHIFANMFSLYFIGSFVEKLIGKKRYVIFYILSGIFAGLFWVILSGYFTFDIPLLVRLFGDPYIPGIGASGALFGLVGILAVLTPKTRVYLIAGPLIAIISESILVAILQQNGLADTAPYSSIISIASIVLMLYFFVALFAMLSFDPKFRRIAFPVELQMWVLPFVAIIPLMIIGFFISLPIGNIVHLGGLIAGLFYAYLLKVKYPKKTRMLARMFK